MKLLLRARRGFTLIELLIVIVIIGILSVGLIPKVIDAPKRARDTTRKADINNIKVALESYYADKNSYPANQVDLYKMTGYFQGGVVPKDPGDQKEYGYKLVTGASGCYILSAKMDVATGGNFDKDASDNSATCTPALGTGKPYFLTVGGN